MQFDGLGSQAHVGGEAQITLGDLGNQAEFTSDVSDRDKITKHHHSQQWQSFEREQSQCHWIRNVFWLG